ncbi:MAG: hypothetical protein IJD16_07745 [Desulfovibrio sp.]|nr:hypothetical protein [Desulfovibrio sp.]
MYGKISFKITLTCLLFLCFCTVTSFTLPAVAVSADSYFADNDIADAYYIKMQTEMADLVRLKVKASNVRVRCGAGSSFELDYIAQKGDIFYAKKQPVHGSDGLLWYEIVGASYRHGDTTVEKMENRYICADLVTTGPLTRDTRDSYGDVGLIKRHIYKILPADPTEFILDRDTPFLPDNESPLVTDMGKTILPAGLKLCYGQYLVSDDGYLEFFANIALPEGHTIKIGTIRLENFACLNFGKYENVIREFINSAVRLNKDRIKNKIGK